MKNKHQMTGFALLPLFLLMAGAALAQGQPQSMKGVNIKGRAPVSKETLKVTLPRPWETKLANGLQVVVLENHKLPTFSMQMVILSGGFSDPEGQPGVAQYVASLLREGTKTRNGKQIAEQVDTIGASLGANAGLSSTTSTVSVSGLTDNLDQAMELFADVILNPSFPDDEFNRLRTRAIAQLRLQRAQPGFLTGEMFSRVMYGAHPAARFSLTAEQLQKLNTDMLRQFHAAHYKPDNAILAVVGAVKPADIVARLNKHFGAWKGGSVTAASIPEVADSGAGKIHLIHRPNSAQINIVLGTQTIKRTDPDYYALEVMNQILGGGASSRLFLNLREDKGYTYGAYSGVSAQKYRGVFRANTEVRPDVTDGAMHELMYELRRLRDEKTPAAEFENAKRTIIGSFALELESPQSVLGDFMTQKMYGLPADYWDTYPRNIAAITPEEVQRVARKYLDLDKLQVIVVGDATKISDVLKKYGTVAVYDTEGKPLKQGE
ncbi:MAG: M16 family metallopeptidase [Blastocatellia bacterium]